jgi:amidohydrolase
MEGLRLTTPPIDEAKDRVKRAVAALDPELRTLSHALHGDPELSLQEFRAAARLTEALENHGFTVERGVAGLETSFVARYGSGRPVVAFLAEYDALPEIGHACGHNLIATWAVGAGVGLRNALPDVPGTIQVIGTPAEETAGGKVVMTRAGIFTGVDAAMMIHGADCTILNQRTIAMTPYTVEFRGRSAHASASPEAGISALDAVLQVFFSINQMRQMLRPAARIHGIITQGGTAVNVVPDRAVAEFQIREEDEAHLKPIRERFRAIVDSAAVATGARAVVTEGTSYRERIPNEALVRAFGGNADDLGIPYQEPTASLASSDTGDVSQTVPTLHPYLQIAPAGTSAHTPEFASAAASPMADGQITAGATLLALTGAEILLNPTLRERSRRAFRDQFGKEPA